MRDSWLEARFRTIEKLGWIALPGPLLVVLAFFLEKGKVQGAVIVTGFLLVIPWCFYVYVMTVWHWKHRYRGTHSDLWGALLLVETSGLFKVVYWLRHIFPDWHGQGRYSR